METHQFVGRKPELKFLDNILHEARGGMGKVVLIAGDAGTGKTGLLKHFAGKLNNDEAFAVTHIECNDKEGLNAYAPFKQALIELNSIVNTAGNAGKSQMINKLKDFVMEAGPQWLGFIPIIGNVAAAGITTMQAYNKHYGKNPEVKQLQSESEVHLTFDSALRDMAKSKTLVLIFDDVQWADASSINLLFAIARQIRQFPYRIMLICAFRNSDLQLGRNVITAEGKNEWVRHPFLDTLNELRNYTKREIHIKRADNWFSEIQMPLFTNSELLELIENRFPGNMFPATFSENLMKLSGGNVLFITETLNSLLQQGVIYFNTSGKAGLYEHKMTELPSSVEGIIAERIQHLGDELKKVLDYASVAGESFSIQVLEQVLKMDELDLLEFVEKLSKKHGLVQPKGSEKLAGLLIDLYQFTNTLVHHYVYENMEGARRRALHRRIADIMKQVYGDNLERMPEIQAEYMRHSQIGQGLIDGITLKLADDALGAGEISHEVVSSARAEYNLALHNFRQYSMNECMVRLNKALGMLAHDGGKADADILNLKFECYLLQAKAYSWQGLYEKAKEAAYTMEKFTDNNLLKKAIAANRLGFECKKLGLLNEAEASHEKALKLLEKQSDEVEMALTKMHLASVTFEKGFYEKALEQFEPLIDVFAALLKFQEEAEVLNYIGNCFRYMGVYSKAIEWYQKALKLFTELDNLQFIATCYSNIGLCHNGMGNFDVAIDFFNKALDIDNRLNDKVGLANHNNNVGFALELKGYYDKALTFYIKTLELDESMNNRMPMTTTLNNIGNIYRLKGDYKSSIEYLNKALEINQELNNLPGISTTYSNLGNTAYNAYDLNLAYDFYVKAAEIDEKLGDTMGIANSYTNLGNLAYSKGDYNEALKLYNKVLTIVKANGDKLAEASILTNLGNVNLSQNDSVKAIDFMNKALSIYESAGDYPNMSLVYNNLASVYSNQEKSDLAIKYYKKAIEIDSKIGDTIQLSVHTKHLANELYNNYNYEEAIQLYLKLIKMYEANDQNIIEIAEVYGKIGYYYLNKNKAQEAKLYYLKAVEFALNENFENGAAAYYFNLGNIFKDEEDFKTAVEYYGKSADLYIHTENQVDTADSYKLKGICHMKMKDDKNAAIYLGKARSIYVKHGEDVQEIDMYLNQLSVSNNPRGAAPDFFPPDK